MEHARHCIGITCILALVTAATAQSDKPATDPATWAPADALLYVGITDADQMWANFKRTASYSAFTDKDLKESVKNTQLTNKIIEAVKERFAQILEVEPEQLENPFGGAMAFYAAVPRGGDTDDIAVALASGVGDKALMQRYYKAAVAKLRENADSYESADFAGHAINVFKTDQDEDTEEEGGDEEEEFEEEFDIESDEYDAIMEQLDQLFAPDAMPEEFALCLTDERFIAASSLDEVKRVLRREKSGESLATTDDHKALLRHFKPVGTVRALFNLPRFFELMSQR